MGLAELIGFFYKKVLRCSLIEIGFFKKGTSFLLEGGKFCDIIGAKFHIIGKNIYPCVLIKKSLE